MTWDAGVGAEMAIERVRRVAPRRLTAPTSGAGRGGDE